MLLTEGLLLAALAGCWSDCGSIPYDSPPSYIAAVPSDLAGLAPATNPWEPPRLTAEDSSGTLRLIIFSSGELRHREPSIAMSRSSFPKGAIDAALVHAPNRLQKRQLHRDASIAAFIRPRDAVDIFRYAEFIVRGRKSWRGCYPFSLLWRPRCPFGQTLDLPTGPSSTQPGNSTIACAFIRSDFDNLFRERTGKSTSACTSARIEPVGPVSRSGRGSVSHGAELWVFVALGLVRIALSTSSIYGTVASQIRASGSVSARDGRPSKSSSGGIPCHSRRQLWLSVWPFAVKFWAACRYGSIGRFRAALLLAVAPYGYATAQRGIQSDPCVGKVRKPHAASASTASCPIQRNGS